MTALVVLDDESSFRTDFLEYAKDAGFAARAFAQPREFFASFDEIFATQDVVCFVDHDLKHAMSGLDVISKIREQNTRAPLVLLTNSDDQEVAFNAGLRGATLFSNKDHLLHHSDLENLVGQTLRESHRQAEIGIRKTHESYLNMTNLVRFFVHDAKGTFAPIRQSTSQAANLVEGVIKKEINVNELVLALDELKQAHRFSMEGLDYVGHLEEFVSSGNSTVKPERVDVRVFLQGCARDFCSPARSVEITSDVEDAYFDPAIVRRIVRSLLTNIEDHLGENVSVAISASSKVVNDTSILRLEVRDDGPGIPPELIERIFEPGMVNGELRSNPGQNRGLGLAIAKTFAELHIVGDVRGTLFCQACTTGAWFVLEIPMDAEP